MARILALLGHPGNRQILPKILGAHELVTPEGRELPETSVDMIVTDPASLSRWQDQIRQRRADESHTLLPVLLILPESQLKSSSRRLGLDYEDVVITPIHPPELIARVDNMIRLRQLTSQLHERAQNRDTALRHINRAFRIFSTCNEQVIRAESEKVLLENVLECLIGDDGYPLAWFGLALDDAERSVDMVAQSNVATKDLTHLELTWGPDRHGQGPVGRAIREKLPQVSQDVHNDPCFSALLESPHLADIRSVLALPVIIDEASIGVLVIYAHRINAFSDSEIELMHRLGQNIAYGLRALRNQRALFKEKMQAEKRAYRDALTGLPNRQWMLEKLQTLDTEAARHDRVAAVLFIDLDGFKLINDGLGHDVGDRLLCWVAERIRSLVRDEDFVARQGGDEFLVVMPYETSPGVKSARLDVSNAAARVAARIVEGMRRAFSDGNHEHHVGVSIGISLFPDDSDQAVELVNYADKAMYQAKLRGGNDYHFYSKAISTQRRQQLELESRLHHAVDHREFTLYYHPIVDLATGQVDKVEALLRWPQANGEIVSPADFIPVLEESGLIVRLGEWIIEQACVDLSRCREHVPNLRVAINLSVHQLWQTTLTQQIRTIVDENGLPPQALELEVTESSMMSDIPRVEKLLHDFHEEGFTISIDDFGTGYSSLSRLAHLPVNTLKLDKSFLEAVGQDSTSQALVTTIVQLARNLDLSVVAEGIESQQQLQLLTDLNCSFGQGFLFTKPLPLSDLLNYLDHPKTSLEA